jgi:cobalt-zinc-cadmium resistance protein CzcA
VLEKIIMFSIKNKLIIGLMTLLLIIWGGWSASKLPIDAVPDITNNQVQIITLCPTLAGQEVEQLVTYPIEQSLANLPDLEETRSISRFGLSVITVVFDDKVNIYFARQIISERLKEATDKIPKGIGTPELAPVSTGLGEIYQYILHPKKGSENKYSAMELRSMQDWIVARQLRGTPGIAEINSFGGKLKQYEVAINPNRLKAMGVSVPDIFNALEKNNQNTGGAYIDKKPNAYFIRGVGLVTSLEDIGNIVVKSNSNSVPILIKDVAKVQFGNAVRYGALTYNGELDAVGGIVLMLKGANSNEVVKSIKEKIPLIQKSLPDDVIIEAFIDRSEFVSRAITTVQTNLTEGALIVVFVLVLFLGNFRAGLIVASAIPLSLLFALGMMNVFGVTASLMSLGAIDFGLIVDGAVIIVEASLFFLEHQKNEVKLTQSEMDTAVGDSAKKLMSSAAFGQIIIMIVYFPILSLVGIEGKMFGPMAKTVLFAIIGAMLLSLTYIPMVSALFLPKKMSHKKTFSERMMNFIHRIYQPMLEKVIRVKYMVVATTLAILALTIFVFSRMGGEFIPTLAEGDYAFEFKMPLETSLSQSIETSMQASKIAKQFDEVKMVVGKTGAGEVPTDPMPPGATDLMIILKPQKEWKSKKTFDELGEEIEDKLKVIPGVFIERSQPIQMRFNELMTGIKQDVAIKIFGENLDTLAQYGTKVQGVIQSVEGVSAPQVEQVDGLPQINIEYDRQRMANYGLNVEDVNSIVSTAFAGRTAGSVYENERRYDLVVRLDSAYRSSIDDVSNLIIPISNGNQIPLSQVAKVEYKLGPAQISREAGKRRIVIGFNVKDRDVQSVVREIQQKLGAQVKLPAGYYFTYGGTFENLEKASKRLLVAVPLSLLLIFILLYFTFSSIKQASLIFTAIPMSAIGGVFALLIRGMPFSISAGIGFIALFGVAVLNGIVLIGTFNNLEKEGWTDVIKRVIEGTKIRLRPVLMTATVASLGFLPMAISHSAGAEVQKPLATVVIGGLLSATFLTLFVLPLLYIIANTKFRFGKKIKIKAEPVASTVLMLLAYQMLTAQTVSPLKTMTVDECIKIALSSNLEIKAQGLQIIGVQKLKRTAAELPKTDVNVQFGQYNSINFDNAVQVSQTIPFPTLFGARKQLITAEIKSKEISKEATEFEVKAQVRNHYYEILYLQINRIKLRYLDSLYVDFVNASSLRYKSGETSKLEKTTAETKRGEISLLLSQNETDITNAYTSLKACMNITEDFYLDSSQYYIPLKVATVVDSNTVASNPIVKLLYQNAIVAEQNKRVERALGLPDFKLGYNNLSLVGFQNVNNQDVFFRSRDRFHVGNIGITIPLTYGATIARIKALEYQKQSYQATAANQQKQITAQLQNALQQYDQFLRQFDYYQNQALPNSRDIIDAAKLGFRTGSISYVEYLLALQTSTDIELNYLRAIQKLNQSVININYLISK